MFPRVSIFVFNVVFMHEMLRCGVDMRWRTVQTELLYLL